MFNMLGFHQSKRIIANITKLYEARNPVGFVCSFGRIIGFVYIFQTKIQQKDIARHKCVKVEMIVSLDCAGTR